MKIRDRILLYDGRDSQLHEQLLMAAHRFGLEVVVVDDSCIRPLGELFVRKESVIERKTSMIPCIVFEQGRTQTIDAFRRFLKKQGIQYDGAMAVLTKHNRTWTLQAFLEEIMHEHVFFQAYDALSKLWKESQIYQAKDYEGNSYQTLVHARMHASIALSKKDKDAIDTARQQLMKAIIQLKKQ